MKISHKIAEEILKNSSLSMKLMPILGIKQVSVEQLARRRSNRLCHYKAIELYKQYGFTEDDILEMEETAK